MFMVNWYHGTLVPSSLSRHLAVLPKATAEKSRELAPTAACDNPRQLMRIVKNWFRFWENDRHRNSD
jgi:hypothetical protein